MGNWRLKLALLFTIINTIGIIAVIPYELTLMGDQSVPGGLPNRVQMIQEL
jgi:hypothetical protein